MYWADTSQYLISAFVAVAAGIALWWGLAGASAGLVLLIIAIVALDASPAAPATSVA